MRYVTPTQNDLVLPIREKRAVIPVNRVYVPSTARFFFRLIANMHKLRVRGGKPLARDPGKISTFVEV